MTYDPHDREPAGRVYGAAGMALKESDLLRQYRDRLAAVPAAADVAALKRRHKIALDAAYYLFVHQKVYLPDGRPEAKRLWRIRREEVHAAFAARLQEIEGAAARDAVGASEREQAEVAEAQSRVGEVDHGEG